MEDYLQYFESSVLDGTLVSNTYSSTTNHSVLCNSLWKWGGLAILSGLLAFGIYHANQHTSTLDTRTEKVTKKQRIEEALKDNVRRTRDLTLGAVPEDGLVKALEETRRLQQQFATRKNKLASARFRERGPKNIGGRTRTILIDANDPTRRTIFVGGVTGGLWKSTDITAAEPKWEKINDYLDNLSVGALAQDPNDPQLMYMGTGEGYTSAAGAGIFISTNGGADWKLLPATQNADFRYTNTMIVHPSGDVYAGTRNGLYRSQTQGQSWEKINLPGGANIVYDLFYLAVNDMIYASSRSSVHRSQSGDTNDWEDLASASSGFPTNWSRTEVTISPQNPNIMYAIGSIGGSVTNVYRTQTGGAAWQNVGKVGGIPDFTNGQAWYDLEIQVDPFNPQHVIASGVPIFRSLDGALTWNNFAFNMHVDHHLTLFDPEQRGVVYFGNDGGIYRSENGSANSVQNRNLDYNVTQFYAGAIHPDPYTDYILGGTQDNNSLQMNDFEIANARNVNGGDGMLCHIDQSDPQYQIVSSQFGNYVLSTNGGKTFGGGAAVNGAFVNPSDYDNDANILYAQTFDGDLYRWRVPTGQPELMNILGIDPDVATVYADPSTPNRIYLGTFGDGRLLRLDNVNEGLTVDPVILRPSIGGTVSSVAVQKDDPDHILVTLSNYGLRNNVYESKDGGATWIGSEGNLPDMPVRSCLFAPDDPTKAVIATEAGVWFTEALAGEETEWIPPATGIGTPIVRTDMLQLRESDKVILAATYGRGMFTSDIFADPKAIYRLDEIAYTDVDIPFLGEYSYGATDYLWEFGDGATSEDGNTTHKYDKVGSYDISFTINGDEELKETTSIKVLPDLGLPYELESENYSGSFEGRTQDYGVYTISGSAFERGRTDIINKNGTKDGDNAFVVGLNEEFYQPNTETMLYLPNFDFSEKRIYEFSFWYRAGLQDGFDGFTVEYSTDKGITWEQLGEESPSWFNFTAEGNEPGYAFDAGTSYFGRSRNRFTQAFTDVTFLGGQPDVAFRFVFKSNDVGNHNGLVIDQVEVKKFDGEPITDIVSLSADYISSESINVSWTTQPEYYASRFILERSFNGKTFEEIEKVRPTGILTGRVQNYELETQGIRDLYFFRIRSLNENQADDYYYEFETPIIVVSRQEEGTLDALRIFPNPFVDQIEMTFTNVVEEPLELRIIDASGRLIQEQTVEVQGVYTIINTGLLPAGVYTLQYRIGEREAKSVQLFTNGG
ncbi:MAG: PKD domain-containing protein [Bacteroidota bacterium]